jgi:hypothetical protein
MPEIPISSVEDNFTTLPKEKKKRKRKRRNYTPKFRRHIYLTEGSCEEIDKKAEVMTGNNFSMMVQILVSLGLKQLRDSEKVERKGDIIDGRAVERFYDAQKNSCIEYKGQLITEFFVGTMPDKMDTLYYYNNKQYATIKEVLDLVDAEKIK